MMVPTILLLATMTLGSDDDLQRAIDNSLLDAPLAAPTVGRNDAGAPSRPRWRSGVLPDASLPPRWRWRFDALASASRSSSQPAPVGRDAPEAPSRPLWSFDYVPTEENDTFTMIIGENGVVEDVIPNVPHSTDILDGEAQDISTQPAECAVCMDKTPEILGESSSSSPSSSSTSPSPKGPPTTFGQYVPQDTSTYKGQGGKGKEKSCYDMTGTRFGTLGTIIEPLERHAL